MHSSRHESDPMVLRTADVPLSVPLVVSHSQQVRPAPQPVTVGCPLPKGAIFCGEGLVLRDRRGRVYPAQVEVLQRWTDGSLKWIVVDFIVDSHADGPLEYQLVHDHEVAARNAYGRLAATKVGKGYHIDTGRYTFIVNEAVFKPFDSVVVDGLELVRGKECTTVLIDESGQPYVPHIRDIHVERRGPVKVTLKVEGDFRSTDESSLVDFVASINFYAETGLIQLNLTVRNPRAARHPGGLWDLGDEGSVFLKGLWLDFCLLSHNPPTVHWTAEPDSPVQAGRYTMFQIYQDSSGGVNWNSTNHVNRFGKVMHTFQGYRVIADGAGVGGGRRASPVVKLSGDSGSVSAAVEGFWQNFPKGIGVHGNVVRVSLFPPEFNDTHELQGGEQKTHTLWLNFERDEQPEAHLEWVHNKLTAGTTPEWYAHSQAIPYLHPRERDRQESAPLAMAEALVESAVHGTHSFFDRREVIDEYGWRNFGDLYADHEAVRHKEDVPLVAHYNNQYDVIYGAIVQYLRTGDRQWYRLMDDLAKHVIDIDIYHTKQDRVEFNGGMFWHTEHYTDASTATHRAYSKSTLSSRSRHLCGGGPSCGHVYTTGLMYYHFLTGDSQAREAVLGLADWIIALDDGSHRTLGWLDRRPTGLISLTVDLDYHGPGRGPGNSTNALLDAYTLTQDRRYLHKAEQLIRRCVHPQDDIEKHTLHDVEHRWSYTVFLQALCKFLDVKVEEEQLDYMYEYARESLLHYARWMLEHEVPYKSVLDRVEIPTETWPAQDIRKCNVLALAALYASEPLRTKCFEKAGAFFEACIRDLLSFSTCSLTRPIVILMTNAYVWPYMLAHRDQTRPFAGRQHDFARPQRFKPQMYELQKARAVVWGAMESAKQIARRVGWVCGDVRGESGGSRD